MHHTALFEHEEHCSALQRWETRDDMFHPNRMLNAILDYMLQLIDDPADCKRLDDIVDAEGADELPEPAVPGSSVRATGVASKLRAAS